MYATAEKDGEEDAAVFTGSPEAIFIVLHSNAHVMMKARDRQEGGFYGTVSASAGPRPMWQQLEREPLTVLPVKRAAAVL